MPPPPPKRRPPSDTTTAETSPKRLKLAHLTRLPPAFWDNLSKIPPTSSAMQELKRGDDAAASAAAAASSHTSAVRPGPPRRPITRRPASESYRVRYAVHSPLSASLVDVFFLSLKAVIISHMSQMSEKECLNFESKS
ncbi:hypothetical protein F4808DRAFT_438588 [Astrocystis sublimbata]|nr:hypothetical protein F4808DRAFT_438588 [Astrocystis sublimbata]